jgi:hypothetical protein
VHFATGALDTRQPIEHLAQARAQGIEVRASLVEEGPDRAALLVEQGLQEVHGLDELMIAAERERLGLR